MDGVIVGTAPTLGRGTSVRGLLFEDGQRQRLRMFHEPEVDRALGGKEVNLVRSQDQCRKMLLFCDAMTVS